MKINTISLGLFLAFSTVVSAENLSLKIETKLAVQRALAFLADQQNDAGYWSTSDHPALTGLAVKAFATSPVGGVAGQQNPAVKKGAEFILTKVQPDGGIYTKGEGLANYNTSISMMALHAMGDYADVVRSARQYVVRGQQLGYAKGTEAYDYYGGVGYGGSSNYSDMVNTNFAMQSLEETKDILIEYSDDPRLDWKAALQFLDHCQNMDEPASSPNRGGFIYRPSDSKAGDFTLENGETVKRSYGSVSYAGLMSFAYAELAPSDPRVEGVLEWLGEHWSLDENPGMDQQGLYYYYMTMALGLDATGLDKLTTKTAGDINWREALTVRLLELQKADGSWRNENGRWMEQDPNLVTAYTLLALNKIYPDL